MKNDIYNEEKKPIYKLTEDKQNKIIEKIKIKKLSFFKNYANENINENINSKQSTSRSLFSIKNSFHNEVFINKLKINLQQKEINNFDGNGNKIRKDNFGNEIKKGGKQKIVFADEIKVAESLLEINNKSFSKNNKKKKFSSSKQLDDELLLKTETYRRSYTPKNNRASLMKSIYNLYKYKIKNKTFEDFLVNVIKIECTKKETKINTFSVKKMNNSEEEEQVCCSCYCSIW